MVCATPRSGATEREGQPMNVVGLFRVSTEKQAEHGASLEAQEQTYLAMAEQQGWRTVATFKGAESATGASSDRRVLQQVLACIRERDVDAIWVYEQSRLTRGDQLEVAYLTRELEERGVKVIINGTVRDLASIDEGFMFGIQSLVDRTEGRRIKERMSRGRRQKAMNGKKTCGAAPYGYRNPPPGAPDRGTLQVVEQEALVVRRVFRMAADGESANAIAAALNARGIASPRGGQWGKTSINRMLQNPAYIGTMASNVWVEKGRGNFVLDLENPRAIVKENAHEPIVDRQTWDAVHNRGKQPTVKVPRMLTGLLHVNGVRYGGDSNRGVRFYRACDRRTGSPWIERDEMDRTVWEAFTSLATGPEFVERLLEESRNSREQQILAMDLEFAEDNLRKAQRRYDRLVDMRADGEIDGNEFRRRAEVERDKIAGLEAEVRSMRAKSTVFDGTSAARLVRAVQALLPSSGRLTVAQKRRLLRSLVTAVDVEAEPLENDFKRDEAGRVLPGHTPRWRITRVSFRVRLPPQDAACGRAAAETAPGSPTAADATDANDGPRRPRQLDTTDCSWARRAPARR